MQLYCASKASLEAREEAEADVEAEVARTEVGAEPAVAEEK